MKRSLHIGINDYPGTEMDLEGCVNDANAWQMALNKWGFEEQTLLLDGNATKVAVERKIADVIGSTAPGDVAVITYSGHGTWVPSANSRHEALCPYDLVDNGPVTDATLFSLLCERVGGSQVVFISDTCHAGKLAKIGTMADAPFAEDGWKHPAARFVPPTLFMPSQKLQDCQEVEHQLHREKMCESPSLLMLASAADEMAYDVWINGSPCGAFTHVALWCLAQMNKSNTYQNWLGLIQQYLPTMAYPQAPRLCGPKFAPHWKLFDANSSS